MIKKYWQILKNSFRKFLRGEEDFWITLLGWGIGFYIILIVIFIAVIPLFLQFTVLTSNLWDVAKIILFGLFMVAIQLCGILWFLLLIVYPFIFIFSLVKSSLKHSIIYKIFACFMVFVFLILHFGVIRFLAVALTILLNSPAILLFKQIQSFFL
jgi:hypothetical protein